MRRYRAWAETFILVTTWDWLGTISIRYISEQSWLAIPLAVALCGFWWVAAKRAQQRRTLIPALSGAAVGTLLGLTWL